MLWGYEVVAQALVVDAQIPQLAGFGTGRATLDRPVSGIGWLEFVGDIAVQGRAWVGGQWRGVRTQRIGTGFGLEVEGIGRFHVSDDGCEIVCTEADPKIDRSTLSEAIVGPCLILALALQGTWCLHASAVLSGGRLVAIVGESGLGKSTLAAFLDAQGSPWRRVADDILPFALRHDGLTALPRFPQLKLSPDRQPSIGMPERMPLEAIYVLAPADVAAAPDLRPLTKQEVALALVRHTVAARLFDRDLLAHHLDVCSQAAGLVPVRRLLYPHRLDLLADVAQLLAEDISQLPSAGALPSVDFV